MKWLFGWKKSEKARVKINLGKLTNVNKNREEQNDFLSEKCGRKGWIFGFVQFLDLLSQKKNGIFPFFFSYFASRIGLKVECIWGPGLLLGRTNGYWVLSC